MPGARDNLSWDHLRLIRRLWPGKLVVKGILSEHDARDARDCGADGLIVSNHGGRHIDTTVTTATALAEIAPALAGKAEIYVDCGIRRGTDVLKALALGAKFVFVGRPFLFAAAIAGQAGVEHAAGLLSQEINRDMALLGLNRPDEMTTALLRPIGRA